MVATRTFQAPQPAQPNVEDDTVMIDAEMSLSVLAQQFEPEPIVKSELLKNSISSSQHPHYMDAPVIQANASFGEDQKAVKVQKPN